MQFSDNNQHQQGFPPDGPAFPPPSYYPQAGGQQQAQAFPPPQQQQQQYPQGYQGMGYPQQAPFPQQAPQAFPPQQQQYYPQGYQAPGYPQQAPMMQTNINVNVQQQGPGFFIRAIYFLFFGWWFGLFWLNIGFGLCALIVTLPVGLMMLNRLPQVMTLKASGTSTNVNVATTSMQAPGGPALYQQNINITVGATQQVNFLVRALYFLFVGCWAGYIWAYLAYFCCLTLVLLPVGVIMFDRLPAVLTLRKN